MPRKRKRSGLDTAAALLSRHVECIAEDNPDGRLTPFDLEETIEISKGLVRIENARTVAVFRALSQRHRAPAELKELLLDLQARDDGGDDDDDGKPTPDTKPRN